jgi:hypothetical protein
MMSKPQLREYLSDMLPAKVGELPPQCTRPVLAQVADVLLDDYYGFCLLKWVAALWNARLTSLGCCLVVFGLLLLAGTTRTSQTN